jgi:hypothetical protein
MCCCCCPSAISALFCLWCQSGCSKGTVAGALTFFPPDPPLYKFERMDREGHTLGDNEYADSNNNDHQSNEKTTSNTFTKRRSRRQDETINNNYNDHDQMELGTTKANGSTEGGDPDDDDDELGVLDSSPRSNSSSMGVPLESSARTNGQTAEKMKSPIEQLTDQARARQKQAILKHTRDVRDVHAGVTYRLLLDPRLELPPFDETLIEAVKIPVISGRHRQIRSYLAAVIYRIPPARVTSRTKTLVYSHGNATDVGAMFPIQVILSHTLDCHVVVYDYSGYGESGGVPLEANTYLDIEAVYVYVRDHVCANGNPANIVLYGQSVGSGPCCYLASQPRKVVGGMILHSPFTSGMRVLTPSRYVQHLL